LDSSNQNFQNSGICIGNIARHMGSHFQNRTGTEVASMEVLLPSVDGFFSAMELGMKLFKPKCRIYVLSCPQFHSWIFIINLFFFFLLAPFFSTASPKPAIEYFLPFPPVLETSTSLPLTPISFLDPVPYLFKKCSYSPHTLIITSFFSMFEFS